MGLATQIAGADFSALNIGNVLFPVTSGLVALHFLGTDGPTSVRNRVSGGAPAVVGGAPTYGTNYATLNNNSAGTAYLDVPTPLAAAFTVCVIAKEIDGTQDAMVMSQPGESTLFYIGTTGGRFSAAPTTAGQIDFTAPDMINFDGTKFAFYGLRRAATQGQFSTGFGGSMLTRSLAMTSRAGASTGNLRFGSSATNLDLGTGDRTVDMSMIAVFNRSISDVEMAKVYNDLRTIYARKGISEL